MLSLLSLLILDSTSSSDPNWKAVITPWDNDASSELDSSDNDYDPAQDAKPVPPVQERPSRRALQPRFGRYDVNLPPEIPSSQESAAPMSQASVVDETLATQLFEEIKESFVECS
jgi:hypothetical protein